MRVRGSCSIGRVVLLDDAIGAVDEIDDGRSYQGAQPESRSGRGNIGRGHLMSFLVPKAKLRARGTLQALLFGKRTIVEIVAA
jgi:hypothetical protein